MENQNDPQLQRVDSAEEELEDFHKWLDIAPEDEIPGFLRESNRYRKSKKTITIHEVPMRGGLAGRGRGRILRQTFPERDVSSQHRVVGVGSGAPSHQAPIYREGLGGGREEGSGTPFNLMNGAGGGGGGVVGRGRGRGGGQRWAEMDEQNLGGIDSHQSAIHEVPMNGRGRGRGWTERDAPQQQQSRVIPPVQQQPSRVIPVQQQQQRRPVTAHVGGGHTIFGNHPAAQAQQQRVEMSLSGTNNNVANDQRFQQSLMKQQLESSWDSSVTTRSKKVSMTDAEFYSTVKTAGSPSGGCNHLVIHTNCFHMPDRVFGVCARCYMIFCDETCLKVGISNGQGRVGLASLNFLSSGQFGIRNEDHH